MEWLRIGLAVIVTTAIPVGVFAFVHRRQKRREADNPNHIQDERRRAEQIVINIGTGVVHLIQFAAGLAATIPMFALLIFIASGSSVPKVEDVGFFAVLFVGGWIFLARCLRITDALKEKQ